MRLMKGFIILLTWKYTFWLRYRHNTGRIPYLVRVIVEKRPDLNAKELILTISAGACVSGLDIAGIARILVVLEGSCSSGGGGRGKRSHKPNQSVSA
jgi:hypothetical protein